MELSPMVKDQHKRLLEKLGKMSTRDLKPETLQEITNVLENYKNVVDNLLIKKDL